MNKNSLNLMIRAINKKDLEILSEIYSRVYEVYDVGESWTKKSALKLLQYGLNRQPDLAFLAEVDGKIVGGLVAGVKPWWDGNHLVDGEIFVHPDYQKRGIGTELSKHLYKFAINKYDVVRFDTYTFKKGFALEWYKKNGFEEIKEWVMISGVPKELLSYLAKKK